MKTNIKLFTIGLVAAFGAGLMSCSDSETYDVRGANQNLVYVNPAASAVAECQMYTTPVGCFGDVNTSIPVRLQYRAENTVAVGAVADTSLTSAYNQKYGKKALAVPVEVAQSIVVEPVQIDKDTTMAKENLVVSIPEDKKALLTEEEYVLPLRLTVDGTEGERHLATSQDLGIRYLAIHNVKTLVGLSTTENTANICKTPAGITGSVNANYKVSLKRAIDSDIKAELKPAAGLVAEYNTAHSTAYKALPDNVASAFVYTAADIAAGSTTGTVNVASGNADFSTLDCETYLLPLQFTTTYSNGEVNEAEKAVAYLFVTVEENQIQDSPSAVQGKTVSDISAWKCLSAVNFNPEKMTTSYWVPLKKQAQGEFVIDFGASHKVAGYMKPECYMGCGNAKLWLSEDGTTWKSTGSSNGKGTARDANGKDCYVFYNSVNARYAKLQFTIDTGSYMWNYLPYDWAASYVGVSWNIVFND